VQKIIVEKRIESAMPTDLFHFMNLVLREEKDPDLPSIFKSFAKNRDSSRLLTSLIVHCEERL